METKTSLNHENPSAAKPLLTAVPMRVFGEEIVETKEDCPFCEDGKVTRHKWDTMLLVVLCQGIAANGLAVDTVRIIKN